MRVLFIFLLFFTQRAWSHANIPSGLDESDRIKVLNILGFGTSSKILTDPYPLGGFAGFEVGVQMDAIPVGDLARLGNTADQKDYFCYPVISVGKGLYNNVDIFAHFLPFSQGTSISEYGGVLRWGFYQMAYIPISFSISGNANSVNINNQLITRNFGTDLTVGLSAQNFYMYSGFGVAQAKGEFIGGVNGITDDGNTDNNSSKKNHIFFGMGFRFDGIFVTAQADHFTQTNYSLKLGYRY